jgi:hypothetical protein
MIIRLSAHDETAARSPQTGLSRREARFIDDLMIAAAALAIAGVTWLVVTAIGV